MLIKHFDAFSREIEKVQEGDPTYHIYEKFADEYNTYFELQSALENFRQKVGTIEEVKNHLGTVLDRVEVLHASIVKNTVGATLASQPVSWYDLSVLPKTGDYDFVLVDGPEGGNADPLARYGAFPLLQDRLAPGTLMLLDDGVRSGETEVVQRWLELEPRLKATFLKSEDGLWAIQLPGA